MATLKYGELSQDTHKALQSSLTPCRYLILQSAKASRSNGWLVLRLIGFGKLSHVIPPSRHGLLLLSKDTWRRQVIGLAGKKHTTDTTYSECQMSVKADQCYTERNIFVCNHRKIRTPTRLTNARAQLHTHHHDIPVIKRFLSQGRSRSKNFSKIYPQRFELSC